LIDRIPEITLRPDQPRLVAEASRLASRVRLIAQIAIVLKRENDQEGLFSEARRQVVNWLEGQAGAKLPVGAWAGDSFESDELGSHRVAAIALDTTRYWSARLDRADREVPQRSWIAEFGLAPHSDDTVAFGCRLQCVTLGEDPPFVRTVPSVVRRLFDIAPTFLDTYRVYRNPSVVRSSADVSWLIRLIRDPGRQRDVIVFSLPDGSDDANHAIVDTIEIARKCMGSGHLIIITSEASYELTDFLGKELSVFRQAVRTYHPGFVLDDADPAGHPLALPERITNWKGVGPSAFAEFVVDRLLASTVRGRDLEHELPSFSTAKRTVLQMDRAARKAAGDESQDLLGLAEEELGYLKQQLDEKTAETDALLQQADTEREQLERTVEENRNEISGLRSRLRALELRERGSIQSLETIIPTSCEELSEWTREYLSGSVVVLPRAFRSAKKSHFADVPLVYRALLLLRDYYVPMRRSELGRAEYEQSLHELGLEDQPCFAGGRASEQGDEYFVLYNSVRRILDRHLKGSNARDPRFGFRLYFFWDEESAQVVVGSFPNHLTTSAS